MGVSFNKTSSLSVSKIILSITSNLSGSTKFFKISKFGSKIEEASLHLQIFKETSFFTLLSAEFI